jgi:hypothetical protein
MGIVKKVGRAPVPECSRDFPTFKVELVRGHDRAL